MLKPDTMDCAICLSTLSGPAEGPTPEELVYMLYGEGSDYAAAYVDDADTPLAERMPAPLATDDPEYDRGIARLTLDDYERLRKRSAQSAERFRAAKSWYSSEKLEDEEELGFGARQRSALPLQRLNRPDSHHSASIEKCSRSS